MLAAVAPAPPVGGLGSCEVGLDVFPVVRGGRGHCAWLSGCLGRHVGALLRSLLGLCGGKRFRCCAWLWVELGTTRFWFYCWGLAAVLSGGVHPEGRLVRPCPGTPWGVSGDCVGLR